MEGDDTACTAAGLAFVSAAARRSVPNIRFGESIRNFAGVRANVDTGDFVIGEAEGAPGFIDLAGMKSPGLSSAPAVAREAVKILEGPRRPARRQDGLQGWPHQVRFKECSPEEKARLIAEENPHTAAWSAGARPSPRARSWTPCTKRSPPPPSTASSAAAVPVWGAVRAALRARVLELISKTLGISPLDVLQGKAGTNVLLCETKQEGEHHD